MSSSEGEKYKMILELGPIAAFVVSYYMGDRIIESFGLEQWVEKPIFLATVVLLIATPIALLISRVINGTFPIMPTFTLFVVVIFAALTLYFQNEVFIKMKPTILNVLYGLALLGGLWWRKSLLKILMGTALKMDDIGWNKLTFNWALFFFLLAIVNEIVWRNTTESFWVGFKLWGMTGLTFIFIMSQAPMIMKHTNEDQK